MLRDGYTRRKLLIRHGRASGFPATHGPDRSFANRAATSADGVRPYGDPTERRHMRPDESLEAPLQVDLETKVDYAAVASNQGHLAVGMASRRQTEHA